jgi:hypothetical protein
MVVLNRTGASERSWNLDLENTDFSFPYVE